MEVYEQWFCQKGMMKISAPVFGRTELIWRAVLLNMWFRKKEVTKVSATLCGRIELIWFLCEKNKENKVVYQRLYHHFFTFRKLCFSKSGNILLVVYTQYLLYVTMDDSFF